MTQGQMTQRPMQRPTAVAGTWYPRDPARLAADVDALLAQVGGEPLPQPVKALVAPHAGLVYSGPVAAYAYAYAAARAADWATVVLIGPSHYVPFSGVSIWPRGAWDTPFGPVGVDAGLAAAIHAQSDEMTDRADAHGREHSLEMQMPFIARLLPGVPIVPLVMGQQTRRTALAAGDAIARAIAARAPGAGSVLLVASSDLSHFEPADTAAALDAVVLTHVAALDAEGLMTTLEREPGHACGGGPMVSVLHAARRLGATSARVLRYADSGDVSGDKSSVVGYMAAAIW